MKLRRNLLILSVLVFSLWGIPAGLISCRTARVVPPSRCEYGGRPVSIQEFCDSPFGHGEQRADFQATYPAIRVSMVVSRPTVLREIPDTLYDCRLPRGGKILLYRLPDGRERLVVATLRNEDFPLLNGVRIGQERELIVERIKGFPTGRDTVEIQPPSSPRRTRFIFGPDNRLARFEVVGAVEPGELMLPFR